MILRLTLRSPRPSLRLPTVSAIPWSLLLLSAGAPRTSSSVSITLYLRLLESSVGLTWKVDYRFHSVEWPILPALWGLPAGCVRPVRRWIDQPSFSGSWWRHDCWGTSTPLSLPVPQKGQFFGWKTQVTNHLFRERPNNFGMDLASRNIHRGREHGVPSYNTFRAYCGLKPAETWVDLAGVFPNDTLTRYAQVYSSPDDIDLWSGGISEEPQRGSMVGPVFACILGEGFRNLRFGDRFWYENPGWPSSFTLGKDY